MLQNTVTEAFTLCATCHIKNRVTRRAFASTHASELENYFAAEYHYLSRDYSQAMAATQEYFEMGDRSQNRDSIVLQRILTIGVEVRRDLEFSVMQLSASMKYLQDGDYNAQRVSAWITLLSRLNADSDTLQSPIGKNLSELDSFLSNEWPSIRTSLGVSEQEAYWIVIRGQLNRLLQDSDNEHLPSICYWLAIADRELQYRFYGSLSRACLEQRMTNFPTDPFVPMEVRERIQSMRQQIAENQPKK
jgi:hypothetical protein